eukprot:PITA_02855
MRNSEKCNLYFAANSWKQATVVFYLITFLFITGFPSVISEMRYFICTNGSSYAGGSTFSSNLNRVMSDLVKNAPQTGFSISFYGQSPNRIYGLLQCIGNNVSRKDCSNCAQQASNSVRQLCVNDIGGQEWQERCFLRYQNYSFFSKLDTHGDYLENAKLIVTNNLIDFKITTSNLLSNLSDQAYHPANKGFAQGSTGYPSVGTIYGLVQCLRDLSIKDCRSCLESARNKIRGCCSMKQGAQALLGSCTVRYEIYPFFNVTGGISTSPPPSSGSAGASHPTVASETPRVKRKDSSTNTLLVILSITIGGVVIALMVCLFAMRNKVKSVISQKLVTHAQNKEIYENSPESTILQQEQILFTLNALIEATDNFHENKKLGEGGFGPVYKGTTRDGNEIAVKKLSVESGQGKVEFMNEVELVANVQHRNLVKLIGCCAEGPERLLVYEYLPNRSLDTFLFDAEKKRFLDWEKRYNIIMGIARGLLYLHEDSHLRIIHRDIKANNILLDEEFNPKIADFGLARLFPEDKNHIQTRAAGTYGYMAPEYAMRGQLSVKTDIYSFGVLVLEIVTGRKSSDTDFPPEIETLLEWAWILFKNGNLLTVIDSTLRETCWEEQVLRCIQVALLCTQADAGIRPTISNVIPMISSSSVTLPIPTHPAFMKRNLQGSTARGSSEGIHELSSTSSHVTSLGPSVNDVTIPELEPR